jgi:hypothetical protein
MSMIRDGRTKSGLRYHSSLSNRGNVIVYLRDSVDKDGKARLRDEMRKLYGERKVMFSGA